MSNLKNLVNRKYIRFGKFRRPRFDVNFLIANPDMRAYFAMCIAEREPGPDGTRRTPAEELSSLIDDQYINESEREHYASLPTCDSGSVWAY